MIVNAKKNKVSLGATQVTKCHYLLIYTLIGVYSKMIFFTEHNP